LSAQAVQHLADCLNALKRIKFFGQLLGDEKIGAEVEKKTMLLRAVSLDLAKATLEENRDLSQAQESLRTYLALESNFNQVTELETYLKGLRVIPENDADLPIKNVRQLSFDVLLMFKLHKYRQIISLGSQLQRSLLLSDPSVNRDLSEIFQMVGDSYLKLDFVYESEVFYQKALELTPGNPEVLFRMKKYYERRNETAKLLEVDRRLAEVLSSGDLLTQPRLLAKGASFDQTLLMNVNQKRVRVDLQFGLLPGNPRPLVSIYLNDRVYWEEYLQGPAVGLELGVEEGFNRLQIAVVNGPVALIKLSITPL
jgi:tetratricopeptide (TPR) repeat protein